MQHAKEILKKEQGHLLRLWSEERSKLTANEEYHKKIVNKIADLQNELFETETALKILEINTEERELRKEYHRKHEILFRKF